MKEIIFGDTFDSNTGLLLGGFYNLFELTQITPLMIRFTRGNSFFKQASESILLFEDDLFWDIKLSELENLLDDYFESEHNQTRKINHFFNKNFINWSRQFYDRQCIASF